MNVSRTNASASSANVLGIAIATALSTTIFAASSCSVFDESMRRPEVGIDSGTSSSTSSTSSTSTSSSGGLTGKCEMILGGAGGTSNCAATTGGTFTGENEEEPNDNTPNTMGFEHAFCGVVAAGETDKVTFNLGEGDCASFEAEGSAEIHLQGGGVDQRLQGAGTVKFDPSTGGSVLVTITLPASATAPTTYRIVVR